MRPDSLLGPGLGSRFGGFWEGSARKPDGPTEKSSLGPGLGRFFRPDSRARPGLGSHFQFWALSWPGPTQPGPRGCPGILHNKSGALDLPKKTPEIIISMCTRQIKRLSYPCKWMARFSWYSIDVYGVQGTVKMLFREGV
jgi:hypothetical protein